MSALPKQHRLPAKAFEKTFQQGKNWSGVFLGLKVRRQAAPTKSRFGFAVGLKTSKKAVQRNRLKRQLKAAVYELLPQLRTGFDVIVLTRPGALGQEYQELKRGLITLLKKAGVLANNSK